MPKSAGTPQKVGRGSFDAYVPRGVREHLASGSEQLSWSVDGTMVFCDLSGFTKLSERLQKRGREGAELLTEAIDSCFSELLSVAHAAGGSLVKFGGDALLLFFDGPGHARRACRAAAGMRLALRRRGPVMAGGARVVLRMTVGVHTGTYDFFLVGSSHLEHLVAGPTATAVVETEGGATTGQIVISAATAALLPHACVGEARGPGFLLRRAPEAPAWQAAEDPGDLDDDRTGRTLSTAVRAHVSGGRQPPEHRLVSVAFLRFGGTDRLMADEGPAGTAAALDELVRDVAAAADEFDVSFLGSDVDAGGGKLILCAGAPRVVGDDEERLLCALRRITDGERRIPVRIGVNRGPAFAGDIGSAHRRVYTLMGDTVNLAARLMARAEPGSIYATAGVLEHSRTRFRTTALEPFVAKGKAHPVLAWEVGPAERSTPQSGQAREPVDGPPGSVDGAMALVGREAEMALIADALAEAQSGRGGLMTMTGDSGVGKSRLLAEARRLAAAAGMASLRVTCDAYTATVPYAPAADLLRQALGLGWSDGDAEVLAALRAHVAAHDPALSGWIPLIAAVLDVPAPPTPEVERLAPEYRASVTHDAVRRLLTPALAHPTLVEIDDAHAVDEASAALLAALGPTLRTAAWLVLTTRRGASTLAAGSEGRVVPLGPLSPPLATALAEAATAAMPLPPHVSALAVERSGGNPQYLLHMLTAVTSGGEAALPDSAGAAAMARIDTLPPADRSLVRQVSVLGMAFPRDLVDGVLEPGRPAPDTRTWRRLGDVFEQDGSQVRFRSAALREAAYTSLPFKVRRQLHAAAASALEGNGGDGSADPAVLSLHLVLAGHHDRAFPLAVTAARHASARAAPADAARLYRRALEAGRESMVPAATMSALWEDLAAALRLAGEGSAAEAALGQARRLVPDDPLRQAQLFYRHARLAGRAGRLPAAIRWAGRGLRSADGVAGPAGASQRACLMAVLASARYRQGRFPAAIRLCHQAMAEAEAVGEELALARAWYILDASLIRAQQATQPIHSDRALAIFERLGEREEASKAHNNLGAMAYWAGRWDEAVRRYRAGAELCHQVGDVNGAAYGDCNLGEVLSDQGRFDDARLHLGRALRTWRATGDEAGVVFVSMLLGRLEVRTGAAADGLAQLTAAHETMTRLGMEEHAALTEALMAEAAAFAGDAARSLDLVDRLGASPAHRPLLARVRAFALARGGAGPAFVAAALEDALGAAREDGAEYEVAVTLDALCRLGFTDVSAWTVERDDLFRRLGVEQLPEPPLAPAEIDLSQTPAEGPRR